MAQREKSDSFVFDNRDWTEYVLNTSALGIWSMVTDRGMREAKMYVDRTMAKLLGIVEPLSPEECFEY